MLDGPPGDSCSMCAFPVVEPLSLAEGVVVDLGLCLDPNVDLCPCRNLCCCSHFDSAIVLVVYQLVVAPLFVFELLLVMECLQFELVLVVVTG